MHTTLSKKIFQNVSPFIILVMTVFRILAGLRIPYMILANQRYDDRMLFENAYDLLNGVWLAATIPMHSPKGSDIRCFWYLRKIYVCHIPCCWLYCRLPVHGCLSAHYPSDGRIPMDRRPVSAPVIFSHQPDAVGDTAPVPYGYCSRNGAGCIFRHDRTYPAQGASL